MTWCEENQRYDCPHTLSEVVKELEAENARLRAALTEIEHYSNSLMGWAAPYGDSVFHKIVRPGQLARKALASE